jgi:hypothetical protein
MSLINSVDQSRVIRTSTYASNNPAQWGTNITPISLQNLPQVQKIYNRVYSASSISVGSNNTNTPKEIIKYTNVFIQQNYVTATAANLTFTNGNLTQNNGTSNITALGVGKLVIPISPFDNYYKFTFVKEGPNGIPVAIDLSNSGLYKIVFLDDAGNKNYVPSLQDNNIAKPALGELAFKVDESQSTKVLKFTDRRFFITNGNVTAQAQTVAVEGTGIVQAAANPNSNTFAQNTSVVATETVSASSMPLTTQTPVSNESTSVLFWGYWRKEGEVAVPTTETPVPVQPVVPVSSGNQLVGSIQAAPANIIQSIRPASSGKIGVFSGNLASNVNTSQKLTGTALISALSAQIQGYVATGWAEQTIVDYFLTPGKPGYIQYSGLTGDQFKKAANGILSTATLSKIK